MSPTDPFIRQQTTAGVARAAPKAAWRTAREAIGCVMNYPASIFLILAILATLFGFGFDSAWATSWAGVAAIIFGLGFVSALIVDFLDKRSH